MKKTFSHPLLASIAMIGLFLFLLPLHTDAKTKHPLVGVWTMTYQSTDRPIVCYKLLKKDGTFINLKSMDKGGQYFYVTHQGKFVPEKEKYSEFLMEESGKKTPFPVEIPIKYKIVNKDTLRTSFYLGRKYYEETWIRTKKAPKY